MMAISFLVPDGPLESVANVRHFASFILLLHHHPLHDL